MIAEAPPALCPRCNKPLLKDRDELFCLVHGTIYTPKRAWDIAAGVDDDQRAGLVDYDIRVRGDTHHGFVVPEAERIALAAVEQDDPDAMDVDEWDAAIGHANGSQLFEERQPCPKCGKRTMVKRKCTVCPADPVSGRTRTKNWRARKRELAALRAQSSGDMPPCRA